MKFCHIKTRDPKLSYDKCSSMTPPVLIHNVKKNTQQPQTHSFIFYATLNIPDIYIMSEMFNNFQK